MPVLDVDGLRGREDYIGDSVENFRMQFFSKQLAVMHKSRGRRVYGNPAELEQHAPLNVEEPMPLSEPNTLVVDGTRPGDQVVH